MDIYYVFSYVLRIRSTLSILIPTQYLINYHVLAESWLGHQSGLLVHASVARNNYPVVNTK